MVLTTDIRIRTAIARRCHFENGFVLYHSKPLGEYLPLSESVCGGEEILNGF